MLAGMGDGIESDPSYLTTSCSFDKHAWRSRRDNGVHVTLRNHAKRGFSQFGTAARSPPLRGQAPHGESHQRGQ